MAIATFTVRGLGAYRRAADVEPDSVAALLRRYREREEISQNALAKIVAVDASYLNRIELGIRDRPTREIIHALARALALPPADYDALMASAGYLPPSLQKLGAGDSTVAALVGVLGNDRIDPASRADFRACIETMAARWQGMEQPKAERRAS